MTREEAVNTLGNFKRYISGGGVTDLKANEAIDMAIEALKADRPRGEWIMHGEPPWHVRECSQCGTKWHQLSGEPNPNYCGNCGADMRSE